MASPARTAAHAGYVRPRPSVNATAPSCRGCPTDAAPVSTSGRERPPSPAARRAGPEFVENSRNDAHHRWHPVGVSYDPTIYQGAAAYYRRGRPAYSPQLEAVLSEGLDLDGSGRLLDAGCGPGILTVRIAHLFEEAVGLARRLGRVRVAGLAERGQLRALAPPRPRELLDWPVAGSPDFSAKSCGG